MLFKKKDALALAERDAAIALSSFQSAKDGLESANARLAQIKADATAAVSKTQDDAQAAVDQIRTEAVATVKAHYARHSLAHRAHEANARVIAKLDDLLGL